MDKSLIVPSPDLMVSYTIFFRLELLLGVLAILPSASAMFLFPFYAPSLKVVLITVLLLYIFFLVVLLFGSIFDYLRFLGKPKTQEFPTSFINKIDKEFLSSLSRAGLPCEFDRMQVLMSDLTMGAHVRGTFSPKIIISGGMLIGLTRNDESAKAILAHELSHIKHYDMLFPGIIFICIANILILVLIMSGLIPNSGVPKSLAIINILTTIILVSVISKRREFAADMRAVSATGDANSYIRVLQKAKEGSSKEGDFFHPSIQDRILAIQSGYPILGKSKLWLFIWVCYILVGISEFESGTGLSMFIVAIFGLLFEFMKNTPYRKL